jgi:hypothetical protein
VVDSLLLSWLLTAVFTVTAGYGLVRAARTYAVAATSALRVGIAVGPAAGPPVGPAANPAAGPTSGPVAGPASPRAVPEAPPLSTASSTMAGLGPHTRAAALSHLLMSLAMVAMVWMWGGPGAQAVQLVVFTGFTAMFLLLGGHAWRAARPDAGAAFGYHALMAGSMVWMLAAMSTMTGHSWSGGAGGGHHDARAEVGVGELIPAVVVAPLWTVFVTAGLVCGLVAAALAWMRALRRGDGDRASATAHVLMSAGMAVMLLVMI